MNEEPEMPVVYDDAPVGSRPKGAIFYRPATGDPNRLWVRVEPNAALCSWVIPAGKVGVSSLGDGAADQGGETQEIDDTEVVRFVPAHTVLG